MRSSKAQILSHVHAVAAIRFTDQTLTSASGLVLFQVLFDRLDLRNRVRRACRHVRGSGDFKLPELFLTLVIHISRPARWPSSAEAAGCPRPRTACAETLS
jgi:hypothetical protein